MLPLLFWIAPSLLAQGFEPASVHPFPGGGSDPVDAVLADLDRDGSLDLVALGGNQLRIAPSVGNDSPPIGTTIPLVRAAFASTLQVVDSNGDGVLDIWVGHGFGLTEVLGDGLGGFAAPVEHSGQSTAFRIGDLDGDGVPDLVRGGSSGLLVQLGLGDGTFAPQRVIPSPDPQYNWVGLGDLDGDSDLDAVAMYGFGVRVRAFLGDGTGTLTRAAAAFEAGGLLSSRCLLVDFDGDGASDLVTLSQSCAVRLSIGGGVFGPPLPLLGGSAFGAAADLDGDGDVDLLRPSASGLVVDPGDGVGGLAPSFVVTMPQPGSVGLAGDVDADGDIDLVSLNAGVFQVRRGAQATPAGIATFGSGTASCAGRIGVAVTSSPTIGNAAFAVRCTNVLPRTSGLVAIGTPVTSGWDPLGIGLVLHLGLALPVGTATTDGAGTAFFALPIPNRPFLAGLRVSAQTVWLENAADGQACSQADYPFASSRALSITLQR